MTPVLPLFRRILPLPEAIDDVGGWAGFFAFAFGATIIPMGSVMTGLYFAACALSLIALLTGRIRQPAAFWISFPVLAALAYFAVEFAAPFLFPNMAAGWFQVGGALHFVFFPLLLAGITASRRRDLFDLFLHGMRLGVIAGFLIALAQVTVFGLTRAEAAMGNALPYASLSLLGAVLSLFGLNSLPRSGWMLAGLAALAGLGGFFLSDSRGPLLALPALLLSLVIAYSPILAGKTALQRLVAVLILAAVAGIGLVASNMPRFQIAYQSFAQSGLLAAEEKSVAYRAAMLHFGWEAAKQRPLLGYGTQNRVEAVHALATKAKVELARYQHLHNDVMNTLVGKGVLGLATLFLIYLLPFATGLACLRTGSVRQSVVAGMALSASYIAFGLTNSLFGHDLMNSFYLGLSAVLIAGFANAPRSPSVAETEKAAP